jgi:hypothetical protein
MGQIRHIPPHTFDVLYRFYKFNHQPGDFLGDMIRGRLFESACRADPANHQYFADILLFIHQYADKVQPDSEMFDLKWESWRTRFSPDATEIDFNRGDDE